MLLFTFLLVVTPGSALMFFILRFIHAHAEVGIARTDAARSQARMIGAQEAAAIAGETARTALGQTSEALAIARKIETVNEQVAGLASTWWPKSMASHQRAAQLAMQEPCQAQTNTRGFCRDASSSLHHRVNSNAAVDVSKADRSAERDSAYARRVA